MQSKLKATNGKSAFTLVELIVSITILAILGTISFIALQGFAADARDAKRISDINNLLEKINIEITRGMNLGDLITDETGTLIAINKEDATSNIGIIDFDKLKENQKSFQDPNGTSYQFAYAEGQITKDNGKEEGYSFMQLATTLEKTNTIKLVGNYFKYNEDDSPSLFKMQNGRYLVDGGSSEGVTHTPLNPYKGEAGVTQGSIYSSTTDLPNGWSDLIVRDGNGSGYIIMDRNLGATNAYNGEEESKDVSVKIETRRGNYYQWGRNTTDWTNGSSSWNYDWQNPQNDNAWGNTIDTPFGINKTARQGPCPSGRHIPSTGEWDILFQTWCKNRQGMSCVISLGSASTWTNLGGKATLANFKNDLKLPFAGRHDGSNGSVLDQGLNGDYWSSSPTDADARGLYFYSSDVRPQCNNRRASGLSVRCFKN